jgi:hypothetical protein
MRLPRRWAILAALTFPTTLQSQSRAIEIGLDGGLQYSFDAELLNISVPFQRVRAAFPSSELLAFEPVLSFTRLSSQGESLTVLGLLVGALYDLSPTRNSTYVRPYVGFEYADASGSGEVHAFDLGVGFGTRQRIAERLAIRFEANVTAAFPEGGGTDAVVGLTMGLSFFTR